MFKKIFYSLFAIYFVVSMLVGAHLSHRLERTRQQLEHYRMELELAKDRESDIAESLRRTGEILNSSVSTLSGIRAQISEIRKNYEAMENRLYSSRVNNDSDNGTSVDSSQK